ncbi:MAG: hypothetical protein KAQ98_05655 [Bacteriovoracaceae bacterium]|nr:hypothetical protein [Bacteriovoracaceae bacterium]
MKEKIIIIIISSAISFMLGFITRMFIPTRKESFDMEKSRTDLSLKLKDEREERGHEFTKALHEVVKLKDSGDKNALVNSYWTLRSCGDKYFSTIECIATFLLSQKIDIKGNETAHYDEVKKCALKTITVYYELLGQVAADNNLQITDTLDENTLKNVRLLMKGNLSQEEYGKLLSAWKIEDNL